jgi:hypothetical protein
VISRAQAVDNSGRIAGSFTTINLSVTAQALAVVPELSSARAVAMFDLVVTCAKPEMLNTVK